MPKNNLPKNVSPLFLQVFYEKDVPGKYTGVMDPVCSEPIFDAKVTTPSILNPDPRLWYR